MRILLDSHVALWWLTDDASTGAHCRQVIASADRAFVSAVTPWELGIKQALGKLTMPDGLIEELESQGFLRLAITAEHATHASRLPAHHRDPFDRMLIAQAQLEGLTLVSADRNLDSYDVELMDARA